MNIAGLYTSGTLPLFMAALLKFRLTELVLVALPGSIIGAVIYWLIGRWYVSLVLSYAAAIVVMHYASQHLQFSPGLIALLRYSLGLVLPPVAVAVSTGYFVAKKFRMHARKIEAR
jgi:membrane protein YqaA with SNARE-associated domain